MARVRVSFDWLKDPNKKARAIIWGGAGILVLAALTITALGVTSTYWFCAEGCHKVQDDTIIAFNESVHSEVNCMACHMPVNANPAVFMLHKMEALGELYLTVTNQYELPLNPESHVSYEMVSEQCEQCHNLENRVVTPSEGIMIDHPIHSENDVNCALCHNRTAHPEDFELTLTDPNTGEPNRRHEDFMVMTACYRCHWLGEDPPSEFEAPGACEACHPPDFDLKPASHKEEGFFPAGHAELAREEASSVAEARMEAEGGGHGEEGSAEEPEAEGTESEETTEEGASLFTGVAVAEEASPAAEPETISEDAEAEEGAEAEEEEAAEEEAEAEEEEESEGGGHGEEGIGFELPTVAEINECRTCHLESFCIGCHGMEIPHPEEFKEPPTPDDPAGHPVISKEKPDKCVMCHGDPEKTFFCDECHHGTAVEWEFDTKVSWTEKQHPDAVAASGVKTCTERCHDAKFCSDCHTGRNIVPESHASATWTKPKTPSVTIYGKEPAQVGAQHALDAQDSIESCEVCHGSGGANATFCKNCHRAEMPHPADFKEFHAKTGRENQAVCLNCHGWPEPCSNCHHIDSSFTKPWLEVHGPSAIKNNPDDCLENCHKKEDCVKCHTAEKVVPASHTNAKFVKDPSDKDAIHVQQYDDNPTICTYCHGDGGPESKFCMDCHKLEMPHPVADDDPQKFPHAEEFQSKKYSKATCENCHNQAFCDSCHHEGSVAGKPWLRYHPTVVEKDGADACFECHEQVYCSNCHVNLAARGLIE